MGSNKEEHNSPQEETGQPDSSESSSRQLSISGGQFGPGSYFGDHGKIEADVIANTVDQSKGISQSTLLEIAKVLAEIKQNLPEIEQNLDEYDDRDLKRSLEDIEDHVNRPSDRRDETILRKSIERVKGILTRVGVMAYLADRLWEVAQPLFD